MPDATPPLPQPSAGEVTLPIPEAAAPASPPPALPGPSAPALEFFSRAEELYNQGHLDAAVTAYRRGLEKEPGNTVAANNLAMVFIEKERFDEAENELRRTLSQGAEDPEILSNLGYVLRKMGKDAAAADIYDRYLQTSPKAEDAEPIRSWITQVRASASSSAPAPAPAPASPPAAAPVPAGEEAALLGQADQAYETEQYQQALELYNQALEVNVDSVAALAGRGRAQVKLGLLEEGLATLKEAAALNPQDAETFYVIGFVLRSLDRNSEATEAYEKFLALHPQAENADKIRAWIQEIHASAPAQAAAAGKAEGEEGKLKLDKQPAWAQALEGSPEGPETGEPVAAASTSQESVAVIPVPAETTAPGGESPPLAVTLPAPDAPAAAAASPGLSPQDAKPPPPEAAPEPAAAAADVDVEQSLAEIREMLAHNDAATALSKAQELVGQNPNLTAAKVLIARSFGRQGEFGKAQAILQNIVTQDENDEAYFFIGRCCQEQGKTREAREAFERCLALTTNEQLKSRAEKNLSELKTADRGVCVSCTKTVAAVELKEVDGKALCADCRHKLEAEPGAAAKPPPAEAPPEKPKAKKKFKRRKKGGGLVKAFVGLLVLALLGAGGGAGLYFAAPEIYQSLRDRLPSSLPLPHASISVPDSGGDDDGGEPDGDDDGDDDDNGDDDDDGGEPGPKDNGAKPPAKPPAVDPEKLRIASLPFTEAVVGVEYTYIVKVAGEEAKDATFDLEFDRAVANQRFDRKTGVLKWTPTLADLAGGPLTITLLAQSGEVKAKPQANVVKLRRPVSAKTLGVVVPTIPGEAVFLASGDLTGDKRDDILVARGNYWDGSLILYAATGGKWEKKDTLIFKGRPVGVAIGDFGGGKNQAAVVDYWNSSIFLVDFADGKLRRQPGEPVRLDGRPALAAFGNPNGKGPLGVAVLIPSERLVAVYDADPGGELAFFKELSLPIDDALWKSLHLAEMNRDPKNSWAELALVRLGTSRPNVYVTNLKQGKRWIPCNVHEGVAQAVVTGDVAGPLAPGRSDLAIVGGPRGLNATLYTLLGQARGETTKDLPLSLATAGPVLGVAAADLDGNQTADLVFFLRQRLLFRLRAVPGRKARLAAVNLPAGTLPPLGPVVTGEFTGDGAQDVVYLDRGGKLILVSAPLAP